MGQDRRCGGAEHAFPFPARRLHHGVQVFEPRASAALFRECARRVFRAARRQGVALRVACDNAAIASMAFRELSHGKPPSFAVVPHPLRGSKWSDERVEAFAGLCRKAKMRCDVFAGSLSADWDEARRNAPARAKSLEAWASALPRHCAVFAVNDHAAGETARALAAARRSLPYDATLLGSDALDAQDGAAGPATVSSVRLDFEHSGYLAAKLLGTAASGSANPTIRAATRLTFSPAGTPSSTPRATSASFRRSTSTTCPCRTASSRSTP